MDNKEYLEKIANEARALKPAKQKMLGISLSPLAWKLIIGGIILTIIMIFVGMLIGSSGDKNQERDYVDQIYFRTKNLISNTNKYNKLVKSSKLRSMGTSLVAILTETQYGVNNSLKSDFEAKNLEKPNKEETKTNEENLSIEMVNKLEDGRLNGILDRVYSLELAYQIGMLISLESDVISRSKKTGLVDLLQKSKTNLDSLYEQFNNFSAE